MELALYMGDCMMIEIRVAFIFYFHFWVQILTINFSLKKKKMEDFSKKKKGISQNERVNLSI